MEWTSGVLKIRETSSWDASDMRYKPLYLQLPISPCNFFRYVRLSEFAYLNAMVYSIFMLQFIQD